MNQLYTNEAIDMSEEKDGDVLVISKEIYLALQPLEQIAAQALQKVGKVKILYKDPKFKSLEIKS